MDSPRLDGYHADRPGVPLAASVIHLNGVDASSQRHTVTGSIHANQLKKLTGADRKKWGSDVLSTYVHMYSTIALGLYR